MTGGSGSNIIEVFSSIPKKKGGEEFKSSPNQFFQVYLYKFHKISENFREIRRTFSINIFRKISSTPGKFQETFQKKLRNLFQFLRIIHNILIFEKNPYTEKNSYV